ncbi:PrsW family intramembrane metalloprotease [Aeromicrobium sp. Leaf350]|uniref:PrsW family intramembrane metalloprotease n=1 Tax=Aeromicrobium sp. Leaf350 TaxID=2876565 RepID=UPI001E30AF60|nr:PrsW family intramembrane metalloprotease [Aeromicrobium sp. Leaf350]
MTVDAAPPTPGPDLAPAPVRDPWKQRGRLALLIGNGVLGIAAVGLIIYLGIRADSARAVVLGIALGLIPLPLVGLFYWWMDRYDPEPRRYVVAAFLWGAAGAVGIALVFNELLATTFDLSDSATATFVAPFVEETGKGLFLLATFLRARRVIGGLLDGLLFAGVVGLGFAFVENVLYYSASYLGGPELGISGAQGATATFVIRGIVSPFAHPLFTSALGLAIGFAVLTRSWWARVPIVIGGWIGSMVLHGMWNGSISYVGPLGFILFYLLLMLVFAGFVVLAVMLRLRQFAVLRRSLSYLAQRGWIHPAELPWLTWFGYRAQARRHAREHGGREAVRDLRRYQALATDLAFSHDGVMLRRPLRRGVDHTLAVRAEMDEIRPRLHLPPALTPLPRPPVPQPFPAYFGPGAPPRPWS